MEHNITRRSFLLGSMQAMALPALCGFPGLALANAPTNKRMVLVFLRGGMDSLGAIIPYADPAYAQIRRNLAMQERDEQMIDLDGQFAFHRQLKPLHDFYRRGELSVIHAVATPYRERSHFDAQDLLENGTGAANGIKTGWLNRTIQALGGESLDTTLGLSIGPSTQTILRGDAKVTSWSPSRLKEADADLLSRIGRMYERDELLHESLEVAMENLDIADMKGAVKRGDRSFIPAMEAAAKFLGQPTGPRIAVVDMNGWDTHANQGTQNGRLPNLLGILSEGITKYRKTTPDAIWNDTIIYVVTEFGRTVQPNGSNGTDHGTAGASMVLGGRINGGQVIADWPGLASNQLFEGRDLRPTTDLRAVSKTILAKHFDIPTGLIDRAILPGSSGLRPVSIL